MINDLRFKIILHSSLIGLLGYLFIGLFLSIANGQSMSNNDYIIKTENLDTAPNTHPVRNNEVKPSMQKPKEHIPSSAPFSVALSSDIVDFGALSPTNPIIRTVDLTVSNIPSYGYSVLAFENNALKNNKIFIPNATCDSGECSHEIAGEWINPLSFGFGYRCDNVIGRDCGSSFFNSNFYKHFADISNSQTPQSVMVSAESGNRSVRLSYKVNISGTQTQGVYNNIITYIAVPNF
ncbi:MAG: hypothetical protein A3C22_00980 [Candidatus Levybacteria bacterium RIFCSPHIGHO2_02_FULL_37_10]|nr:MAG: hypothetical protein A3C22_00980 [Candidatus Levybacteria bacterium RIFCSPHIGHO2_02_FULL_37_10]OGH42566.1 MAG: hypothetical protein A3H79_03955 [Candidatus Levybacteria bacterium RIFCSPLOWO2_02_FULL_36_8b]